ncbi:MAG: lipopolysaccharide export system permease protein [Rickettsiales bacterium]|jgi:lipopolysaccharide export system permease protein
MINIFELLGRVEGKEIDLWNIALLDILPVPDFIEKITIFLVMLSAMITLFSLSIRSEITVMRASGLSFWRILFPIATSSFLLGLFFILIFNPLAIQASKKWNIMNQTLIDGLEIDSLSPRSGIWLKQENVLNKNNDIIIRANKIYRQNLVMEDVSVWFFDQNYQFYKKIDAKTMSLENGKWHLKQAILNDKNVINQKIPAIEIATNLEKDFITKKVLNNFEEVHLFSIYELPSLIENLKSSGFSPKKFVTYYHSLMVKPFLFAAIALIAAFFAVNNIRGKNNITMLVCGIAVGLIAYISLIIINAVGSSGIIPFFLATWMTAIILLAISVLLIFKKEAIN